MIYQITYNINIVLTFCEAPHMCSSNDVSPFRKVVVLGACRDSIIDMMMPRVGTSSP